MARLSPEAAAMNQLQQLCGARLLEVTEIRPCEVVTERGVWLYQPRSPQSGPCRRR